ncbi:MAG: Sir2 family NAD-dependent protein deacetylase [Rhodospirillales bacterium]|nr:Sir2 family NAD-dependent protein deacetylase [Rhodospirillales bacterium]MDP6645784.1 Sir2 family NAD-dependent protein deacetylase [Rhodospirillales bacterium]
MASDEVEIFRDFLGESSRAVVFTGAGISTESGIPDFRSPGGVWTKNQPVYFQDFIDSEDARRESWRRKIETDKVMLEAKPNLGHLAISKLAQRGGVASLITQNIDGLHQASGVPDDMIIELHGNSTYSTCLDCAKRYENQPIKDAFEADGTLPVCEDCGGIVKTATISFGQPMPEAEMLRAQEATLACDLFIAIGSSLVVFPAAGFPVMAKQNGARLVILNRDPTEMDDTADLVINDEIGATLRQVVPLD